MLFYAKNSPMETAMWHGALSRCSIQVRVMLGRTGATLSWVFQGLPDKSLTVCSGGTNSLWTIPWLLKKTNEQQFDFGFAHSRFLGTGRVCSVPLPTLAFCLGVVLHNLWFITCDKATEEFWLPLKAVQKIKAHIPPISLLISREFLWNHHGAHFSHVQMLC